MAGAGACPVVSGTVRPAVFGAGLGAGPGAAGAVAADCAAGPDVVGWPTWPMPIRNRKPNSMTNAPIPNGVTA